MDAHPPDDPRQTSIARSWKRCVDSGLDPVHAPLLELAAHQHLRQQLEANAKLITFAQPILEHLYQQLAKSSSMVLLADSDGLILRAVGDPSFVNRASRVALMPGATWSEDNMGTNAIGTALHETRIVAVCGDDHFLERNRFLTCIATPILAPTGGMLGILDLSTDRRVTLPHAQALLTTTAEMIEHRLLECLEGGQVLVRFSTHAELLGGPLEALAVFDDGGGMRACNRRARAFLGFEPEDRLPSFQECFGVEWRALGRLMNEVRRNGAARLRGPRQREFLARFQLRGEGDNRAFLVSPRATANDATPFERLDHGDLRMHEAIHRARRIAGRDIPLLIQGETGTGKELFAQAFHRDGPRGRGPFVAVNCAAIPANLIEAELFGYAPGAYTGARSKGARGKLVEADGGTLFLDEIGDMPLNLQSVLLRVLETRCVTPLASVEEIPIDIALVCASHRSLNRMVAEGHFRADLLFRLNGLMVSLPPLRERTDFDAIVDAVISEEAGTVPIRMGHSALSRLRRHAWPGNIRQLKNVLRVAIALLGEDEYVLTENHLPEELLEDLASEGVDTLSPTHRDLRSTELRLIRECLARHGGNVSAAARELGITRTTLYRKLRQTPD
ncbi:MAG: sigma-54-dependent Fis family transcriptional regulator [Zoogloeaceae bacterium]|nr:sigma-54-dependent Fis family transcriptional regulator [Zoogloeaceae bacterium]